MAIKNILEAEGITFSHNNKVVLLTSGHEKFDDMFKAIEQAENSIHLQYFNFRNDSIAFALFNLLEEKVDDGVEVRILYDAFGNSSNNKPLKKRHIKQLRQKGIQIYEFDPITFPWVNHSFARDHRKIVVIDGSIAYTGGMNVADYYLHGTEQVGSWRDMHCRIEGGAVNQLQMIFTNTWEQTTGEDIWSQKYFRAYQPTDAFVGLKPDTTSTAGHKSVAIINRVPNKSNEIIRTFYNGVINSARDSIKIINPYFTLTPSIKKSIKNALKRGVKVEIMISEKSDIPLTPDVAYRNVYQLMKLGAVIWIYRPGFHHTKIIMVDGKVCTVGSANLNARSLRWDYETNAVIIDNETTKELDTIFEQDKHDSILLTAETWKNLRNPWQKFRGWFGSLIANFL